METFSRIEDRNKMFQKQTSIDNFYKKRNQFAINLRKAKRHQQANKYRKSLQNDYSHTFSNQTMQTILVSQSNHQQKLLQIFKVLQTIQTPNQRIMCYNTIQTLIASSQNFRFSLLLQIGYLPNITQGLYSTDPSEKEITSWLICNIASEGSQVSEFLINQQIHLMCLQLINPLQTHQFVDNILWCLSNIAGQSLEKKMVLLQKNALQTILALLEVDEDIPMKWVKTGCWTISNLVKGKQLLTIQQLQKLLDFIQIILNLGDKICTKHCLNILSIVSNGNQRRIDQILKYNFSSFLLIYITDNSDQFTLLSLITIGNLLTGNALSTQKILYLGVLDKISHVIHSNNNDIRKQAYWALSNIAAGNSQQINILLDHPVGVKAFKGINDSYQKVRLEASWILLNIIRTANYKHVLKMISLGILPYLTQAFNDSSMNQQYLYNLLHFSYGILQTAWQQSDYQIETEFENKGCRQAIQSVLFLLDSKNYGTAEELLRVFFPYSQNVEENELNPLNPFGF